MTANTRVTITGTGVPHLAPGRAGPGVCIRSGATTLQFDAGRATTLRLVEAGIPLRTLSALFLTHHHSDHMIGLVDVVFTRWLENQGTHEPLRIIAPDGPAARYASHMLDPWKDDIDVRMQHVGRPDGPTPIVETFEASAEPTLIWENDDLRVWAGLVHHEPVEPAVGFRIEAPDGIVAISGDTRVCDELETLARGADVFVSEAFRRDVVLAFAEQLPQIRHIADYHADTVALGALAERAGVPRLVLTHLIPAPGSEAGRQGFEDDVRKGGYTGEVIVANDLDTVALR